MFRIEDTESHPARPLATVAETHCTRGLNNTPGFESYAPTATGCIGPGKTVTRLQKASRGISLAGNIGRDF